MIVEVPTEESVPPEVDCLREGHANDVGREAFV